MWENKNTWQEVHFDLLGKTELSIEGITLDNADLGQIAYIVAQVLGVERKDLLVTDVRGDNLVLDILKRGVDPHKLVGKERELLESLSKLPGVYLSDKTTISSRGLLSWIGADSVEARRALEQSERMAMEIRRKLEKTAVVYSTGIEVANGQVMDTNSPAIRERLEREGFTVKFGPTLKDDEDLIAGAIRQSAEDCYGLVITTGGVGAEDKDRTVEAILMLDHQAVTPSIVKYELGVGRHKHKDSVRIAVGQVFDTLVVALPGPTDEALLGLEVLVKGLRADASREVLAQDIAKALRARLKEKLN